MHFLISLSSQLINGTLACSAKATCAASAIPKPEFTKSSALDRVPFQFRMYENTDDADLTDLHGFIFLSVQIRVHPSNPCSISILPVLGHR